MDMEMMSERQPRIMAIGFLRFFFVLAAPGEASSLEAFLSIAGGNWMPSYAFGML
jgi:hypothetical protein